MFSKVVSSAARRAQPLGARAFSKEIIGIDLGM